MTIIEPLASSVGSRRMGVGTSSLADSFAAGVEAATNAVQADTVVLIIFASARYDLAAIAAGARTVAPASQTIGCTSAGELTANGPTERSLVIIAIEGHGVSVSTGSAVAINGDLRTASATATRCIEWADRRAHSVVLLLSDGLAGRQQDIVRGAYQQVGAEFRLVGACASDNVGTHQNRLLHNGTEFTDCVVAAIISSDAPIGIGVGHGWSPVGAPMMVTDSESVLIRTLDGEPALDRYLTALGAPQEIWDDPSLFSGFAITRPLGLARRGRAEVRCVQTADYEARTITCYAEIPRGAMTMFMRGDDASVLDAAGVACTEALDDLDGAPAIGMVAFDCMARRAVMGNRLSEEIQRIRELAGPVPLAGFYSAGEIARTEGPNGFHNQTLVVMAMA